MLRPVPGAKQRNVCVPQNAAPKWQVESLGRRSMNYKAACPLEGLVRRVASKQTTFAVLGIITKTHGD